jgi:nucleotide-binding universal stress UspA family protein
MKILIAVDGSEQALATVAALIRRLEWFRAPVELTLFYSHPPLPYKHAAAWAGKEAIHSYYEEESVAALATARELLVGHGIGHTVEKRVGEPAHEIVAFAAAAGLDLIVMGTHGHTALANLVMGSVATKVLANAKVPVLFLK